MNKLFKVSQNVNRGYDTHDSFVCCAESEHQAKHFHPSKNIVWCEEKGYFVWKMDGDDYYNDTWCHPDDVYVEYLGESAIPVGMILTSFNAG